MRKTLRAAGALLLAPWLALAAPAAKPPAAPDPLDSARWEDMRRQLFADAPVAFDARIKVSAPSMAENPLNVPITVDATALARDVPGSVREILVFADFNPIVQILRFYPGQATPFLGFRVKLQQSTPLRAAVEARLVRQTGMEESKPPQPTLVVERFERLDGVQACPAKPTR